ncbi:aldehyde dehydrogenase family protein [Kitasatospora sp. MAP5-34]|uniref:aldehyde dehydrogenase family protein n=1 Tax=Kitasatospora sp. MAP5-34 TaxID=3035102 RepID=UPI00247560CF|nr:aldehyde dehydrogenase family protein [Kitasatospora sp. MAP5-34]MDH6577071.1 acyl-CoA reductase-like NAD-dependent aldehyde dehydrogenase [Kitasatospora sp. MAP5-34]
MPHSLTSVTGGKPVTPEADWASFRSTNPARLDDLVALVSLAPAEVFLDSCANAAAAQPGWAAVPAPVRGRVIASMGRLVEANAEALADLVTRETGKTRAEALGEVREIVDTCDFFLGEGRRLYGQTVPSEMPDKQLFTFREPVGTVAVITAGNFPVAVPSWYLVPALLCGNTVVWKPAEYAAATADALFAILSAAGLPPGVLNLVNSDGEATYEGLERALAAGHVQKVGFTGSSQVGARIGELCGRHLQSPCLELGGKNPMVVTADADLALAVDGALFSGFGTAGQRCTSLGLLLVAEPVHDAFVDALSAAVAAAPVGDPTQDVLYGPLLHERFAGQFEEYLGWAGAGHRLSGSTGVGRITADNPRAGFVGDPADGLYYHPTLVDGVRPQDRLFTEETFGPIVPVASFTDLDEAVEFANLSGYGLSAAIYTRSAEAAFAFRKRVRTGMVSINNTTSGAEAHLPFGGTGRSGNGSRQSGVWVLDQFTRWQSVNWDYSGRLQRAQLDVAEPVADTGFRLNADGRPA